MLRQVVIAFMGLLITQTTRYMTKNIEYLKKINLHLQRKKLNFKNSFDKMSTFCRFENNAPFVKIEDYCEANYLSVYWILLSEN